MRRLIQAVAFHPFVTFAVLFFAVLDPSDCSLR
jgi:hypothetical protein